MNRRISEGGGRVVVDFRNCGSRQLFAAYQDFGLLCAQGKVGSALLKTGSEDSEFHYALRDILLTVARVTGARLQFRLALVATHDSTVRVCLAMQRDLRSLGCDARVFRSEREAGRWLEAGGPPPVRPAAKDAA